jgi:putative ABC transport system permease protein
VIMFHMGAEWAEDRNAIGKLQERILAELQRMPGVQAAGMTNFLPAEGATLRYEYALEGASGDADTGKVLTGERTIGGGYLQALRVPLVQGEGCPALRTDFNAPVKVVVNRRFVEKYGNGIPVVGRHLRVVVAWQGPPAEIVGVVADAKEDGLDAPPYPYIYMCLSAGAWPDPDYVVRTSGDPRQILGSVRQLVKSIAPTRAVFGVKTLEEHVESSLDTPRLSAEVLALFAATALTLAAVGLYSLIMLAVTASTKEIGLRVALGANPGKIVARVVADAAVPVLLGLGIGSALAAIALQAKAMRSMLFGVDLTDGITMISVIAMLALVSILAALGPARRAASIDPIQALRED